MRYIVDAFVSDLIHIFNLTLAHFRICIFVIFLTLHINSRQLWVEMLNQWPKEYIITVLNIKHNSMQILNLLQSKIIKREKMSRNKGSSRFSNTIINSSRMTLIHEFHAFIRIIPMRSHLICCHSSNLNILVDWVKHCKSGFESLTINYNIIVKRIQQLSCTLLRQSVPMIHRVESSSEKIYRNLPILLSFQYCCRFRWFLIIPYNIDLRQKLSITLSLCIPLQIFLKYRIVSLPRMRDSQQSKTSFYVNYFSKG